MSVDKQDKGSDLDLEMVGIIVDIVNNPLCPEDVRVQLKRYLESILEGAG